MQPDITDTKATQAFWKARYQNGQTGWDIGHPSPPIKEYIDQLEDKSIRILIPGAGNGHEAAYLYEQGFTSVYILEIAAEPLRIFAEMHPSFPRDQLLYENFFEHQGQYDLILEQTFFCSFPPTPANREVYAKKMHELLLPGGKLVGLWFTFPLQTDQERPPYGGSISEYETYFKPWFDIKTLSEAYHSIKPRRGNEAFGILQKRK
ncbi:MAG TPA: hypothetical protein VJ953_13080 [Saprospiraceae bacterium]|nr:hypothetical protein [Saprospiraceae bacterium]